MTKIQPGCTGDATDLLAGLDRPTYPIAEVAEMLGFSLRAIKTGCTDRKYEHLFVGRQFFMTPAQIRDLVRKVTRTAVDSARPNSADERNRRRAARALRR